MIDLVKQLNTWSEPYLIPGQPEEPGVFIDDLSLYREEAERVGRLIADLIDIEFAPELLKEGQRNAVVESVLEAALPALGISDPIEEGWRTYKAWGGDKRFRDYYSWVLDRLNK